MDAGAGRSPIAPGVAAAAANGMSAGACAISLLLEFAKQTCLPLSGGYRQLADIARLVQPRQRGALPSLTLPRAMQSAQHGGHGAKQCAHDTSERCVGRRQLACDEVRG
jgi:hypothetical protein